LALRNRTSTAPPLAGFPRGRKATQNPEKRTQFTERRVAESLFLMDWRRNFGQRRLLAMQT
jgi:hypothetical protein